MFFKRKNKIESVKNIQTKIQEKQENILENINLKYIPNIPNVPTIQSTQTTDIFNNAKNTNTKNINNISSDSDEEKKINVYKNENKTIENKIKTKFLSEIHNYVAFTMALYLMGFIFQSNNKSFQEMDILSIFVYFDLIFLLLGETKNKIIQLTNNKDHNIFENCKDQITYQMYMLMLSGFFSGIFSCGILVRLNLYHKIYQRLVFFVVLFFYRTLMSYHFVKLIFC